METQKQEDKKVQIISVQYICHSCSEPIDIDIPYPAKNSTFAWKECQNCGISIELAVINVR